MLDCIVAPDKSYDRATSHTRLRARDQHISSTLIGGECGASPSSLLHTTLEGPTEYVCECKMMDCKVYVDPYMASNGSCFLVTWTIFKNCLSEVGLTQNHLRGSIHGIEWIMFLGHLDYIQKLSLGGRPNTKPSGDHGTPNAHNR
jgi:hypothetical protein